MDERLIKVMETGVASPVNGGATFEVLSNRPTRVLLRELDVRFIQMTCGLEGTPYYGKRVLMFAVYDEHLDQEYHEEGNVALADPTVEFDELADPEIGKEPDEMV